MQDASQVAPGEGAAGNDLPSAASHGSGPSLAPLEGPREPRGLARSASNSQPGLAAGLLPEGVSIEVQESTTRDSLRANHAESSGLNFVVDSRARVGEAASNSATLTRSLDERGPATIPESEASSTSVDVSGREKREPSTVRSSTVRSSTVRSSTSDPNARSAASSPRDAPIGDAGHSRQATGQLTHESNTNDVSRPAGTSNPSELESTSARPKNASVAGRGPASVAAAERPKAPTDIHPAPSPSVATSPQPVDLRPSAQMAGEPRPPAAHATASGATALPVAADAPLATAQHQGARPAVGDASAYQPAEEGPREFQPFSGAPGARNKCAPADRQRTTCDRKRQPATRHSATRHSATGHSATEHSATRQSRPQPSAAR